jgi:hypothetical protein
MIKVAAGIHVKKRKPSAMLLGRNAQQNIKPPQTLTPAVPGVSFTPPAAG